MKRLVAFIFLWLIFIPVFSQNKADLDNRFELELRNVLPPASAAPEILRVVTFNVHYGRDVERLARSIQSNSILADGDIFLIQEIESHDKEGSSRASKLAQSLGLNYVYAPVRLTRDGGTHGLAILGRFPLSDIDLLRLPYYGLKRRIALGATVEVAGTPLRVYDVHLDTRINVQQHIAQVRPVVEHALNHPLTPAVIAGDFNTNPFRWLFTAIPIFYSNQAVALDKFVRGQGLSTPTAGSGFTNRGGVFKKRIDSLFTRNLTVRNSGVERGVKSSDHYPVWIDVAWPPGH